MAITTPTTHRRRLRRRQLALLIAAHNEEMVIAHTISSAIAAGQKATHIYVVSDDSTDATRSIATAMLGEANVLQVERSGKALAIQKAIAHFNLESHYHWLHIADADGVFAPTYFRAFKRGLEANREAVAATGHIQSLRGGSWISAYRLYEYTLGLEIMRRVQNFFGVIPVIPGPTSAYRTNILSKLDFDANTLTEDMDITFQIHRKNLGKIAYIPDARCFTQDPRAFGDYYRQILRWYRGGFQVMRRHKIGLRPQRLDAYLSYVMLEQAILVVELITLPFLAWWSQSYGPLAVLFLTDLVVFFGFTAWAAALNRRPDVLSAFPLFYVLRAVNLFVFVKSWYEIVVRRKFQTASASWDVAGRRYAIVADGVGK
jgi:poly-beta-1,6-N-acetyl-D-glucosamine synthase